jgi:hypothetical protein
VGEFKILVANIAEGVDRLKLSLKQELAMGQQQQDLKKSLISPVAREDSPVVIFEEEDILAWDFYLENPPLKPTSTIELEFEYAGRSQPIPVTNS